MRTELRLLIPTALGLALAWLLPSGLQAGWCAQYFNNRTLSGAPDTVRTDNTIDFNWGGGAPAGTGLGVDNFSVRWTTTLRWDANGTFTLRTGSDDGVRVWVDGVLVINNWTDHGYTNDTWSVVKANNNTSLVVMEFYENGGDARAELYWDRPGGGTNYVAVPNNRTTAPACSANTPTFTRSPTRTPTPTNVPAASTPTPTPTPLPAGSCQYESEPGAEPANFAQASSGGRTYIYATASNTTCCSEYKQFPITIGAGAGGTYRMSAWVRPGSGSEDSWFVEIRNAASTAAVLDTNGQGIDVWDQGVPAQHPAGYGNWGSDPVWGRNGTGGAQSIRNWVLPVGTYNVRFYRREANSYLDCFSMEFLSPSASHTPTPMPTPSASPTAAVIVWSGLPSSERLYGLEYIPFPEVRTGSTNLGDLSLTFTSSAANTIGRNTARWRITLQGMSSGLIQAETRIGPYGVTCTTGYYNPEDYTSATALSLPPRPANFTATYAWLNVPVPPTERIDAVGDPRFVPYADVVGQPSNKDHLVLGGYNWFFKPIQDAGWLDHEAEYTAHLPEATRNRYNGQPNVDVPKLMLLWREGIMISRSVYNSLSGWSNYYIGLGGEIGGDSSNNLNDGVPMYGGPWNSASNTYNVDEIIGTDGRGGTNVDGKTMVRSSSTNWRGLPFLGELWPDELYASDWSATGGMGTWGNLRNARQGGSSYRDEWQDVGRNDAAAQAFYTFSQVKHRTQDPGGRSFMNGNNSSGTFNHWGVDYNAVVMTDGNSIATGFNFAMPASFSVNRPWTLNGTVSGDPTPEWTEQPYAGRRNLLDIYSTGFYDSDTTGTSTQRASAAIRVRNAAIDSGGNTMLGYFVVSGLRPSTESGINFVARFSLLTCLQTFLDAGAPTATAIQGAWANLTRNQLGTGQAYRIQPPPLVQVTEPYKGQPLAGNANIQLRWKQRYARWDGDRYTQSYPCVDDNFTPCTASGVGGNPDLEWHDTGAIDFNIKYSLDSGATWYSALTDSPAKTGVYMAGPDSIAFSPTRWYTYGWDVTALPDGKKKVRVEGYRRSLDLHYAYHEIEFETAP